MSSGIRAALALGLGVSLLGCLRALGPNLHARGPHAALRSTTEAETCMSCHESEADALARMRAKPRAEPMSGGTPLVPDWMVTDERTCVACHVLRGEDAR